MNINTGVITESETEYIPFFQIDHQSFKLQTQDDMGTAEFYVNCLTAAFSKIENAKINDNPTKQIKNRQLQ